MTDVSSRLETSRAHQNTEIHNNKTPNSPSIINRFIDAARERFKRPQEQPNPISTSQSRRDDDKPKTRESYIQTPPTSTSEARWDKTIYVKDRLEASRFYEEPDGEAPHGYFKGRPIIGRDTAINGGVYVGQGRREAIVVDFEKSEALAKAYEQLQSVLNPDDTPQTILAKIYAVSTRLLPTSEEGVRRINDEKNTNNDNKISLGVFIGKAGICRHQALLAGAFTERLIKEGKLRGKVSVDRNSIKGRGGHAWVRFEEPGKNPDSTNVTIIDPAQQYVGKLKDVPRNAWFYARPTDNLPRK